MQRFPASGAKYAYSAGHAPIGSVEAGELFEVESVEGWSNYFRSPDDFSPETHAKAEAVKWAVVGPISVEGAVRGGAVAVTIHRVEITTPGVVVYGAYTASDPLEWWDDETAVELFQIDDAVLRFDDHTTLPTRALIGCLAVAPEEGTIHAMLQGRYGGNLDCRELRAGATLVLPVAHDGAGLYFGDCKALMGDGEIAAPPEVGAVVTASVKPRERPACMEWPRIETEESFTTLVSSKPLERSARLAFRELLDWVVDDYRLSRARAAMLLAMVANAGICQISNTAYTAYCTVPRSILQPYARSRVPS